MPFAICALFAHLDATYVFDGGWKKKNTETESNNARGVDNKSEKAMPFVHFLPISFDCSDLLQQRGGSVAVH